ncbi:MAG: hypothetical protein HY423_10705 [Candidatus Lambdaproteobacteria bacterium]|nr:hypothetical protein [Candidatus Lambdaproteobacteria bacterium]
MSHVVAKEGEADSEAREALEVIRKVIDLEGSPLLRLRMAFEISRRYMERRGLLRPTEPPGGMAA